MRPAKAQLSLRIRAVSPEPSLFAHIGMEVYEGSDKKTDLRPQWMAAHACLKNEFTEDEKYDNLTSWQQLFLMFELYSLTSFKI